MDKLLKQELDDLENVINNLLDELRVLSQERDYWYKLATKNEKVTKTPSLMPDGLPF